MMSAIADLIRNTRNCIMLRASPADIAHERDELSKWFAARWAEIERQHQLAKALIESDETLQKLTGQHVRRVGMVMAKHANAERSDMLAKAAPVDKLGAMQIASRCDKVWMVLADQCLEWLKAQDERNARSAEIDRLEKRSDYRFALNAPPPSGAA